MICKAGIEPTAIENCINLSDSFREIPAFVSDIVKHIAISDFKRYLVFFQLLSWWNANVKLLSGIIKNPTHINRLFLLSVLLAIRDAFFSTFSGHERFFSTAIWLAIVWFCWIHFCSLVGRFCSTVVLLLALFLCFGLFTATMDSLSSTLSAIVSFNIDFNWNWCHQLVSKYLCT